MKRNYLLIVKWNFEEKLIKKSIKILKNSDFHPDFNNIIYKIKNDFQKILPHTIITKKPLWEKLNSTDKETTEVYFLNEVPDTKMTFFIDELKNNYISYFIEELYLYNIKKNSPLIINKYKSNYKFPDFIEYLNKEEL